LRAKFKNASIIQSTLQLLKESGYKSIGTISIQLPISLKTSILNIGSPKAKSWVVYSRKNKFQHDLFHSTSEHQGIPAKGYYHFEDIAILWISKYSELVLLRFLTRHIFPIHKMILGLSRW